MSKILFLLFFLSFSAYAKETISIFSPYNAGHSGHTAIDKLLKDINQSQQDYHFVLITKPGAQGIIAIRELEKSPNNSLAIAHAGFVEHIEKNTVVRENYIPIYSVGDACWAVITTAGNELIGIESVKQLNEIVVGTVARGNSTHLTALEIGKKFNINVRLVLFKSNYDALINMVGNHGINFTLERLVNAENYKKINQNLKVLGYSCNVRHKEKLNVRPLREQGIDVPPVFNILVSNKNMDSEKVDRFRNLFNNATRRIGYDSLSELSDMRSSVFDNIDAVQYFDRRILEFRELRKKHQNNLND